jgi:hypothetical protein
MRGNITTTSGRLLMLAQGGGAGYIGARAQPRPSCCLPHKMRPADTALDLLVGGSLNRKLSCEQF